MTELVLGTRGSQLALWQARHVQALLEALEQRVRLEEIVTRGDRIQDRPMSEMGDEAIFTKELDRALLSGHIDLAVHSLKDLPSRLPEGLTLAAVSERADPRDAFVPHPHFDGGLNELPEGATIATSSLRRRAQLKVWRPDLEIVSVRGNVDSRLEKLADSNWHGLLLATAGLVRMDLADRIRERIPPSIMVPAVGQGALAVVCREGEDELQELLREAVLHDDTAVAALAERAFMQRIGGGCQVPTGAWGRFEKGTFVIDGCIAALDGSQLLREKRRCAPEEAAVTGRKLAETLLERGGEEILSSIRGRGRE